MRDKYDALMGSYIAWLLRHRRHIAIVVDVLAIGLIILAALLVISTNNIAFTMYNSPIPTSSVSVVITPGAGGN